LKTSNTVYASVHDAVGADADADGSVNVKGEGAGAVYGDGQGV